MSAKELEVVDFDSCEISETSSIAEIYEGSSERPVNHPTACCTCV